jgi:hypothetical protein
LRGIAGTQLVGLSVVELDEFHYSERLMRQQFRFGSEGQSRSSRLLAERWPECKHRLCRFASNAIVMSRAAGSDELEERPPTAAAACFAR